MVPSSGLGVHSLIVGASGTGKTTLARGLADAALKAGRRVIVLDPLRTRWPCNRLYGDVESLFFDYSRFPPSLIFIDESGTQAGRSVQDKLVKLAIQGRHFGHIAIFIVQIPTRLCPDIRGQCTSLYLFRVAEKYQRLMAEEFVDNSLVRDLRPYFFMRKRGHDPARVMRL